VGVFVACAATVHASAPSLQSWLDGASNIEQWIVSKQEHLHTIPELMFDTPKTYKALEETLSELGISHRRPNSGIGLIAEVGSGAPVVVLRSDIDALPIKEIGSAKIKSGHEGVAHMCGHDGHMAMLLGGARLLHEHRDSLQGTVRIVFQPAEEGGAGGDKMVQEGVLDGASAAFGFHVMPHIPTGYIGSRAGTIMAGASILKITVTGRAGHAAQPHLSRDPVVAASAVVLALQSLVSRETDPLWSSVISITQMDAGSAFNVIPDTVVLQGTVRALDDAWMSTLHRRVQEVAEHQAISYGCQAKVDWREDLSPYYPPTVNDRATHEFAAGVASRLLGRDKVDAETPTLMAGEDFSFFTRAIPSAFMFVGIRNEQLGSVHGLHNANFLLDQAALKTGAALHAALASEWLQHLSNNSSIRGGSDEL